MMQAILGNAAHPEYGVATIPFPIPQAEYANCVALLEALEIGDARDRDCQVQEIRGPWPALKRLEVAKDREAEGRRIAAHLYAAVDWLADIAAIAPLVGLLGTVLGMFRAFGGIATDVSAGAKPVVLAQGVSQAIVTTIFGLAVAIPCLVAYAFFRRRAQRRVAELEVAVEDILGRT